MKSVDHRRSITDVALAGPSVFLLILILHGIYVAVGGVVPARDSNSYSLFADKLIQGHFNYLSLGPWRFIMMSRFAFITTVAIMKIAAGSAWKTVFLGLNVMADALLGALLVTTVRRVTESAFAAFFCLVTFLFAFEITNWSRYVLSDTTFLLLSFASIFAIFNLLLDPASTHVARQWILAIGFLVIGVFYRPPGVIFVFAVAAGFFIWWQSRRNPERTISLTAVLASAVILLFAAALLLDRPSLWPFPWFSKPIATFAHQARIGVVIWDRSITFHRAPSSYLDYLWLVFDRFLHFFYFVTPEFSSRHKISNVIFFVPVYTLSVIGMTLGWSAAAPRQRRVLLLSFVCVLLVAVFHSATQIDFDWRYRLPALPYVFLLASLGAECVRQLVRDAMKRRFSQQDGGYSPSSS